MSSDALVDWFVSARAIAYTWQFPVAGVNTAVRPTELVASPRVLNDLIPVISGCYPCLAS